MRRVFPTLVGVMLLLLLVGQAQPRTSSIRGTVYDESGQVVPGTRIEVRQVSTNRVRLVTSNRRGRFQVPLLEIGLYEVSARKEGFKSSLHTEVHVDVDHEAIVDPILSIGDLQENVVVTGDAWTTEAAVASVTGLIESKTIDELPLNGRDYIQLATLQAGVVVARAQAADANNGWGLPLSISGSRPVQNGFRLDGISLSSYNSSTPGSINGINLGVDAIQEFSVHSSTYGAQYGRAAGGIINAVTKSGGNQLHGSVYYFHRNDNLDARNFFDVGETPEFRRNQFGASLGGPIVRDRTFFFVNYEGLRQARGNTTIDTTLSQAARDGQLTGGNVTVDPVMRQVADLYPLPNGEVFGDTGLFIFPNDTVSDQNFVTTRIDQNLGENDKLFFRYSIDDGSRLSETNLALGLLTNVTRGQSLVLEETHIFSANMLNSGRIGYLRTKTLNGQTMTQVPGTDDPDLAFVPGAAVIGPIVVNDLSDFGGGTNAEDLDNHIFNSYQLSDDFTWIRGRHSFKFGGSFERTHFNTDSRNLQVGEFRFPGIEAFLTNRPNRFRAQLPGSDTIRGHRQWIGALYLQDTLRLTSRLTLDLGARWEWATVPTEVNGKIANLDNLTDPEVRVGDPLFENPSLKNVLPRVGLAWDILGNHRTVLRAGYGVFADLILSQFLIIAGVRNPPFFRRSDIRSLDPGTFPSGAYQALISQGNPETKIERIERHPEQPYVQQWNLNLEQALDRQTSLRIGYVGSHGLNLSLLHGDSNLVEPITLEDGRLFFPADAETINPVFGQIQNRTFEAHSFYHALNAVLLRRLSKGVQANLAYTFSKSIDDGSNYLLANEASNAMQLPLNGHSTFNRGLSGHDVRHHVSASAIWQLPLSDASGLKEMIAGWRIGTIFGYSSGLPFSPRLAYDAAQTKSSTTPWRTGQRPDLAPGASTNPVTGDPRGWIDVGAFQRPEPGFLGNVGRNTIHGPNRAVFDFSLSKRVLIPAWGENTALDFRAEFFNLFNRANFDLPDAQRMEVFDEDGTRPDVGRITSAGQSREIQFGLKLYF